MKKTRFSRTMFSALLGAALLIAATLAVLLSAGPKSSAQELGGCRPPTITLYPSVFPKTEVGDTPPAMSAIVTNPNYESISIRSVTIGDTVNFSVPDSENRCRNVTLGRNAYCSVTIYFQPQSVGQIQTYLTVRYGAYSYVSTLVGGTAYVPQLSPSTSSVDFGTKTINSGPETRTVTLTNVALVPIQVTELTVSGAPFGVAPDCATTIPVGGSCDMQVSFDPTTTGPFSGSVTIRDAYGNDEQIDLAGTGIPPGEPDAGLSTTAIDFGNQTIGTTSSSRPITIVSIGTANLVITSVAVSGQFAIAGDCVKTLAPGEFCTIESTFAPTTAGEQDGVVSFTDNAQDSPQTVALTGVGVDPGQPVVDLSTGQLDFGAQTVGTTSETLYIVLTNVGGVDLYVSDVTASGDFTQENDCVGTVAANGGRCAIAVKFAPQDLGERAGAITITDDASDSPQTVALEGTGTPKLTPQASLSATGLDFGNQVIDTTGAYQTITLTNTGNSDLSIGLTTIDGDYASSYIKRDACRETTLEAGASCTIDVAFSPLSAGTLVAVLSIDDDASDAPQAVALTGVGVSESTGGGCSLMQGR